MKATHESNQELQKFQVEAAQGLVNWHQVPEFLFESAKWDGVGQEDNLNQNGLLCVQVFTATP